MSDGLLQQLTGILRGITSESFYERNRKQDVVYPYLTFEVSIMPIERNQNDVTLTLDLFDHSSSYAALEDLKERVMDALIYRRELNEKFNLIFRFLGAQSIPTGDETIKRVNMRFGIKTDWRTKEYGTP
jgi:hypothetical protein